MNKFAGFIALIVLTGFIVTVVKPQLPAFQKKTAAAPPADDSSLKYGAWAGYWDEVTTLNSLQSAKDHLTYLSPVWYGLSEEGLVTYFPATEQTKIIAAANESGIQIIPTINNEGEGLFDPVRVTLLLSSQARMNRFTDDLAALAVNRNYRGFDIDFENTNPEDRDRFSIFITNLARRFHTHDLILSVTVHAQAGSQLDLPKLASSADQIRLMLYDFHNASSDAGPITPITDLEATLKDALKKVPPQKLVIGLPLYGYDWVAKKGETITFSQIESLKNSISLVSTRDPESGELTATYTASDSAHTIWFPDQEAVSQKIQVARKHGITKFYFWRLGVEDPAVWSSLPKT